MSNPKNILVAYDGSPQSKAALGWALMIAGNLEAELNVVKVFEPLLQSYEVDYYTSQKIIAHRNELEQEDRQLLEDAKKFCEGQGKQKVQADLLYGYATPTLLDYAHEKGMDLIVAGTRGHNALDEMLVGSTTNSLVSLSKVPVLVVKEKQAPAALKKILVSYDGSGCARAALTAALDLARSTGAAVAAVKVSNPQDLLAIYGMAESGSIQTINRQLAELEEENRKLLAQVKEAAAGKGMEISVEIQSGRNIAATVIQYAQEHHADLIVAGTLGHGLVGGVLLGSVTRSLVSLSEVPVLVVK